MLNVILSYDINLIDLFCIAEFAFSSFFPCQSSRVGLEIPELILKLPSFQR